MFRNKEDNIEHNTFNRSHHVPSFIIALLGFPLCLISPTSPNIYKTTTYLHVKCIQPISKLKT